MAEHQISRGSRSKQAQESLSSYPPNSRQCMAPFLLSHRHLKIGQGVRRHNNTRSQCCDKLDKSEILQYRRTAKIEHYCTINDKILHTRTQAMAIRFPTAMSPSPLRSRSSLGERKMRRSRGRGPPPAARDCATRLLAPPFPALRLHPALLLCG